MIVVEAGAAYALNDFSWLAFLERREAGDYVSAASFGCEVGDMVIDAADPAFQNGTAMFLSHDPFADIIVVEADSAVSMAPDDWLAYVEDALTGSAVLADYGTSLGDVAPPSEVLTGPCAGVMASGIRGAHAAVVGRAAPLPSASVSQAA